MRAIVVEPAEPSPRLIWGEAPDPEIGNGDVLVRVRASAVNRADLLQARGSYPPPPGASPILGLEMAGEIAELGSDVHDWTVGDRVCALLPGGGYAELASVPAGMLLRLPDDWSFAQGAAIPEVWLTAFLNLFIEASLGPGETALVHAGASGVGTAAIQLVRASGAKIIVTAGTPEKVARCLELGADVAIDYKRGDFVGRVLEATGGKGVDVILDPVGGDYLERNIRCLARFGRLVNIGLLGGRSGSLDVGALLGKRLHIIGSTLRSRPVEEKIRITAAFRNRFWDALANGTLRPVIDRTFRIRDAGEAHAYVAANKNVGKVILEIE